MSIFAKSMHNVVDSFINTYAHSAQAYKIKQFQILGKKNEKNLCVEMHQMLCIYFKLLPRLDETLVFFVKLDSPLKFNKELFLSGF